MAKNSKPAKSKPKAAKPAKSAKAAKPATKPKAKPAPKAVKPPAKPAPKVVAKAATKAPAKVDPKLAKGAVKPAPGAKGTDAKAGADKNAQTKKNISVVNPKIIKKPKPASIQPPLPPGLGRLLDPKSPIRKPLIPSGPRASKNRPLGQHGGYQPHVDIPDAKSPYTPEELENFRQLLIKKRAELLADVKGMETQALQGNSGSLSNMPSHMAEQGTEASDQSLSLDLAAADRKLIREIDDALARIAAGTFGICELTGKPIKAERIKELPWARYSIEAARELERQSMRG